MKAPSAIVSTLSDRMSLTMVVLAKYPAGMSFISTRTSVSMNLYPL